MSCGRYAEDFDIPVRAPKWRQGHVSVRKLVQSYDVDMLTCGTIVSANYGGTCFVPGMWHVLGALWFAFSLLGSLGSLGSCGQFKCR